MTMFLILIHSKQKETNCWFFFSPHIKAENTYYEKYFLENFAVYA